MKKKRRAIVDIVALAAIAIFVALVCLTNSPGTPKGSATASAPLLGDAPAVTPPPRLAIDAHAGALITPTPAPALRDVAIPAWGSVTLQAGVTESAIALQNPPANEDWYYLTFSMRLKDTGETIFSTGLVPPGLYCNKVILSRALERGEYNVVIRVQPYMMDENQTPMNNADIETILIVK